MTASKWDNILYHQPDECGYSSFDYEVERTREKILESGDIYGVDDRILEVLEDEPEIKAIINGL